MVLNYISRSMLDYAAGGSFMNKTFFEANAILENMLQEISHDILRGRLHHQGKSNPLRK
jgi:hypothetical protein